MVFLSENPAGNAVMVINVKRSQDIAKKYGTKVDFDMYSETGGLGTSRSVLIVGLLIIGWV
jgi:hypothetical protein